MSDIEKKDEMNTEENTVKKDPETEKTEQVEEIKTEEPVKEEAAKAPETEAPKAEAPHITVETAAQPKKAKKAFPWKPVLKVAGVMALSVGCGFGGGYLAGQQSIKSLAATAQNEMSSANGMPDGMMRGKSFSDDSTQSNGSSNGSAATTTGAALGVYVQTNTDNQVVIAGFSDNSTAESAGLQTGDIITSLDGTTVSSYNEITSFLSSKSAGDKVKVVVTRDGKEVSATITLVEKSSISSGSTSGSSGSTNGSAGGSMPSKGKTDTQSGSTTQSSSGSSSSSLQG
jgi:membrane-associated protease RseP (regulator of RpoE activity)